MKNKKDSTLKPREFSRAWYMDKALKKYFKISKENQKENIGAAWTIKKDGWFAKPRASGGDYDIHLNLPNIRKHNAEPRNVLQHEINHSFDWRFRDTQTSKNIHLYEKQPPNDIRRIVHEEYIAKVMPNVEKITNWGMKAISGNKLNRGKTFDTATTGWKKNLPYVKKAMKQYGLKRFNKELTAAEDMLKNHLDHGYNCTINAQMSDTYENIWNIAKGLKAKKVEKK